MGRSVNATVPRKVVGYAVADHLRTSLIIEALAAALLTPKPPKGVIFDSDRGCQYTSKEFATFCTINGVRRSMGRRATCFDNASPNHSSPPTKRNSSTLARGTTWLRSGSTRSCGSKATTTADDDTLPSTT